jgi:hypothetical protein
MMTLLRNAVVRAALCMLLIYSGLPEVVATESDAALQSRILQRISATTIEAQVGSQILILMDVSV